MSVSAHRPGDGDGDGDEGLAGERTDLAWSRTGLSMLAILAALSRKVLATGGAGSVVAVAVGACGALAWWVGLRQARVLAATTPSGRRQADGRTLALIAGGTIVIAAAGALLAVSPP